MITTHDLSNMTAEDAYAETQCNDQIKDGDVLNLGVGCTAVMVRAWPVMVAGECEGFHKLADGMDWETTRGGKYAESAKVARQVANPVAKKVVEYGGSFGRSLITKERFVSSWSHTITQLNRLPNTVKEFEMVDEMRMKLNAMVMAQADAYITEAEAEAAGIPMYKKD